jgi:hypothetical protein
MGRKIATGEYEFEEAEAVVLNRFLRYSKNYSVVAKRGQVIPEADVTKVYFYVKPSASAEWLTFTDADSNQIEWVGDGSTGEINIKLGTTSEGNAGQNQTYELRVQFAGGNWLTLEKGILHVNDSIVDTP